MTDAVYVSEPVTDGVTVQVNVPMAFSVVGQLETTVPSEDDHEIVYGPVPPDMARESVVDWPISNALFDADRAATGALLTVMDCIFELNVYGNVVPASVTITL